jgi:hypothetical protein
MFKVSAVCSKTATSEDLGTARTLDEAFGVVDDADYKYSEEGWDFFAVNRFTGKMFIYTCMPQCPPVWQDVSTYKD